MTRYTYLNYMQEFCFRYARAIEVTRPDDTLLHDIYTNAEEGFFNRIKNISVEDAAEKIPEELEQRLKTFKADVLKVEEEAAYILKGGK